MSNTPSLRELLDFADAFDWNGWAVPKNAQAAFAKAVLAKWGTPQPVGREPLTQEQVSEIADAAHRECDRLVSSGQCAPRWSAVFAYLLERAHGITQRGGSNAE